MSDKTKYFYEFGDFRLDARAKILYHKDAPVALKPKIVENLIVLVENAGEVVSKNDLMNAVWQDTFVAENNLSVNIYALRKAFAEYGESEKNFIQTVSRRGFRFTASVREILRTNGNGKILTETKSEDSAASATIANSISAISPKRENNLIGQFRFRRQNLILALIITVFVAIDASFFAFRKEAASNVELGTKSNEARELYLRGHQLWKTHDNREMYAGIELFERAIKIDPNSVAAHLGIADSYSMLENNSAQWRLAEEHALKALALAPDSAEAYASLGFITTMNKWQWTEAENLFKRALELDPNCGKAHHWYANSLLIERRFDEAETHLKRAIAIDPLSPNYNRDLGEFYFHLSREPEMLAQCRRLNEINPGLNFGVCTEHSILLRDKHYDEMAQIEYKGLLQSGRTREQVENSAWYKAYKAGGWRGWFKWEIEQLRNKPDGYNATYNMSIKYAQLGDRETALRYLEKAFDEHLFLLPFVNVRSEFDDMRDDARFQDLMRRIGLNQN